MKTYTELLQLLEDQRGSEIDFSKSVCEILGNPNPPLMDGKPIDHFSNYGWHALKKKADSAGNSGLSELATVMLKWTEGFKAKRSYTPQQLLDQINKVFGSCPKLGSWLRADGKVYRGGTMPNSSIQSMFKPKEIVSYNEKFREFYFAVGTINYTSSTPCQSWSKDMYVAVGFATGNYQGAPDSDVWNKRNEGRTGYLLEYKIPKTEGLNLDQFGNSSEAEVIRLKNNTIKCKCYIPVVEGPLFMASLVSPLVWKMLSQEQKLKVFGGNQKMLSSFEQDKAWALK
jgi:hypothetical protein